MRHAKFGGRHINLTLIAPVFIRSHHRHVLAFDNFREHNMIDIGPT